MKLPRGDQNTHEMHSSAAKNRQAVADVDEPKAAASREVGETARGVRERRLRYNGFQRKPLSLQPASLGI